MLANKEQVIIEASETNHAEVDVKVKLEERIQDYGTLKSPLPTKTEQNSNALNQVKKGSPFSIAVKAAFCFAEESRILETTCTISIGSVLGVLIRFALSLDSPYSPISNFFANFLGTAVLAFIHGFQKSIDYNPLYYGIGVGFCGSLTTFSSWQLGAGDIVSNTYAAKYTPSQLAYIWFEVQIFGMAVNLMGWDLGKHFVHIVKQKIDPKIEESDLKDTKPLTIAPCHEHPKTRRLFVVSLFLIVVAILIIITYFYPTQLTFGLCWGPFGALLRWRLSKFNPIFPSFPIGTFTANILACGLLGMGYILSEITQPYKIPCNVLLGFDLGFNGSLSTVSTFISELKSMSQTHAYIYGITSVAFAQIVLIFIIGGFSWSQPSVLTPSCGG